MIDVLKRLAELDAQNPNIVKEGSFINGRQQSDDELVWKQTSLSMADAVAQYGKENVKIDGKNRLGEPIVAVKTPLVSKEDQLGELSPDTLRSYAGQARGQGSWAAGVSQALSNRGDNPNPESDKYAAFAQKRFSGADRADAKAGANKPTQSQNYDWSKKGGYGIGNTPVKGATMEGANESLEECGMMGGMSQPHSPASINMTAATGEELSAMLKDIMTLAGQPHMHEPMGGEEPIGGTDGVAVVDVDPSPEVGADDTSVMRSMIDKLNPSSDDSEDNTDEPSDDDEEKVDEYDNTPAPETAGYDSAVPSGNDLHKEKQQFPAAQPGDNAMTMEQRLMAEYKKFINEN